MKKNLVSFMKEKITTFLRILINFRKQFKKTKMSRSVKYQLQAGMSFYYFLIGKKKTGEWSWNNMSRS